LTTLRRARAVVKRIACGATTDFIVKANKKVHLLLGFGKDELTT